MRSGTASLCCEPAHEWLPLGWWEKLGMELLLSVMKQTGIPRRPKLRAMLKLPQSPPRMTVPYPSAAVERVPVEKMLANSRCGREGERVSAGGEVSSDFARCLT